MEPVKRLSAELERAALYAVKKSYDDINGSFFRWKLRSPGFELVDGATRLGRWVGARRVIELSRALLVEHGWGALVEVLKHEMAHQYVAEVLGNPDESSHGPAFRRVCEERGFDHRASGVPAAVQAADPEARVLERIAKLLALAESSNEHEAQAAMSAAQRLMLKHNVERVGAGLGATYSYRQLGAPSGRVSESQRVLAGILGEYFFVTVIWVPVYRPLEGKRGSVLEVSGTIANVELAEYVHTFLVHTAERLWREHRRETRLRGDAGRRSYLAGVMSGFRDKLERERKKNESEGLVWVGDAELDQFFRRRHPNVRTAWYRSTRRSSEYAAGHRAGGSIVLHRGIRAQAAEGPLRALPPRR